MTSDIYNYTYSHHTWALAVSGILIEAALLLLFVWRDALPVWMLVLGQWLSVLCLAISIKMFWQVLHWSGLLAVGGRVRAGGEYIHKIIRGGWLMMVVMVVVRG